jgi:hypothetical protein
LFYIEGKIEEEIPMAIRIMAKLLGELIDIGCDWR